MKPLPKLNGCTMPITEPDPHSFLEEAHGVACLVTSALEARDEDGRGGVSDAIVVAGTRAVETLIELAFWALTIREA